MVSASQYPLLATQSQRVCDTCYREPIRRSSESHSTRRGARSSRAVAFPANQMQRSNSSQSLMIDCPVCGSTFLGMQKNEQEEHLQRCLNVGSPPVQSPRYIGKFPVFFIQLSIENIHHEYKQCMSYRGILLRLAKNVQSALTSLRKVKK